MTRLCKDHPARNFIMKTMPGQALTLYDTKKALSLVLSLVQNSSRSANSLSTRRCNTCSVSQNMRLQIRASDCVLAI